MSKEKIHSDNLVLTAGGFHYGIVAARFNSVFVDRLLRGTLDTLQTHGAESARRL
jgi:6,7-dimethyl-8-ribityllumazine synthase